MQDLFHIGDYMPTTEGTSLATSKKEEIKKLNIHIHQFIESLGININSKQTYTRQIRQFVKWFKRQTVHTYFHELTVQDILLYKESLLRLKKSSNTVDGYVTVVRKLFEWLETKKIAPNIARGVKGQKKSKCLRKDCLTQSQIVLLLGSIDRSTEMGLRDYALINLLVRTGLRVTEISRAHLEDLHILAGEAVLWVQGKKRDVKDEFVLLVEEALLPLQAYIACRPKVLKTDALFTHVRDLKNKYLTTRMISGIVKQRLRNAGLNDRRLSAHSLRHTAIILSIKGGASLLQAQAMARHSDPKTTMTYFHNQARIKKGAERYIKI